MKRQGYGAAEIAEAIKKGTVAAQSIRADVEVKEKTSIDIKLSSGPKQTEPPATAEPEPPKQTQAPSASEPEETKAPIKPVSPNA